MKLSDIICICQQEERGRWLHTICKRAHLGGWAHSGATRVPRPRMAPHTPAEVTSATQAPGDETYRPSTASHWAAQAEEDAGKTPGITTTKVREHPEGHDSKDDTS